MLHPALQRGKPLVGLVEFQTHNDANRACKTLTNDNDWAKGLRATRLFRKDKDAKLGEEEGSKKKKTLRRGDDGDTSESGWSSNVSSRTASPSLHLLNDRTSQRPRASSTGAQSWRQERLQPAGTSSLNQAGTHDRERAVSLGHLDRNKSMSSSTAGTTAASSGAGAGAGGGGGPATPSTSGSGLTTKRSPLGSHALERESRSAPGSAPGSAPTTPRTMRRGLVALAGGGGDGAAPGSNLAATATGAAAVGGPAGASWRTESPALRSASPMPRQNENILRMPRGPEPGKSFSFGRGSKPAPTVTTV